MAIASSGTAETIARMIHAARDDTPLHTFNRFEFTVDELQSVIEPLSKKQTSDDRRGTPGLDPARADIIVAGTLVLEGVADIFGIKSFVFSEAALREGVLLDTIARLQGGALHHLRDVSRRSIRALAERCDDDLDPLRTCRRPWRCSCSTPPNRMHGLPTEAREYLEAGALLANVGLVISHSKHHLHSYYVIRNSELTGLTDAEIEIIAQIARYHRKSAPKASHAEFARLSPEDQRLVKTLAGILRVAIGLDRSHDGRVRSVMAQLRNDRLVIEASSQARQGDQPRAVHRQRAQRSARRGARPARRHRRRSAADRLNTCCGETIRTAAPTSLSSRRTPSWWWSCWWLMAWSSSTSPSSVAPAPWSARSSWWSIDVRCRRVGVGVVERRQAVGLAVLLGLLAILTPHVHEVALLDHRREHLGDRLVHSDATVRRRLQRHVVGTVHGDAVVEVDRVHHPAQRADALALVAPGEPEHAARGLGIGALVLR